MGRWVGVTHVWKGAQQRLGLIKAKSCYIPADRNRLLHLPCQLSCFSTLVRHKDVSHTIKSSHEKVLSVIFLLLLLLLLLSD